MNSPGARMLTCSQHPKRTIRENHPQRERWMVLHQVGGKTRVMCPECKAAFQARQGGR